MSNGWIGVDLDGTLAEYHGWGDGSIGKPVTRMINRVNDWLAEGRTVKIFTARVGPQPSNTELGRMIYKIRDWLENVGLPRDLEITATKDFGMIELWDDRCIQVVPNTGMSIAEYVTTPPHERE
jgi:hypothetical protein